VRCERTISHSVNQVLGKSAAIVRTKTEAATQTDCMFEIRTMTCHSSAVSQFVSWNGDDVIPPLALTAVQGVSCAICLNNYRKMHGYVCKGGAGRCACKTFVCWECLGNSYSAALRPDALKRSTDPAGNLKCCNPKCKAVITLSDLSSGIGSVPAEVLRAQQALVVQRTVALAVSDALTVQKLQLDAEYQRLEQIRDQDERNAHKLHRTLVDEVLTLKCPRCKNAFVDFEGCFAVTCVYPTCNCGFCAWCLTDCGGDAHTHVAACPENRNDRSPWGTEDMFREHHRVRRARKCGEAILAAQLTAQAHRILEELLKKDLQDLGITMEEVSQHYSS
jgi:hypothetical protein